MSITSENRVSGPYSANGVTTVFAFSFAVQSAADLKVVQALEGIETELTTGFTISVNVDQVVSPGGSITFSVAPASPKTITLTSDVAYTQPTVLTKFGAFYPSVINGALDRIVMLIQQLKGMADRSLRLPVSAASGVSTELPVPEAQKLIGWNEAETGLRNFDSSTLATLTAYGTANADQFTGDGSTVGFTLSNNPVVIANLAVSVGGVVQLPTTDYTLSGTTLTFTTAPPNGAPILARYMRGLPQNVPDLTGATGLLDSALIKINRTAAEIAAGVTPTYYTYPAGDVRRYGAVGNGIADDTVALQTAITACIQGGVEMFLPGTSSGGYKITTALSVTGKISIRGEGYGKTAILAFGVNVFNISAGVSQIEMSGVRLNAAVRHTVTPNTLKAINIQGTTASPCNWHSYSDLFIDGFATPIQANGLRDSSIFNVTTVYGKHGIIAEQQTVNVRVLSCLLTGTGSGSYGVQTGDGSAASEGWIISNSVLFGFSRGVWGYGCNNSQVIDNLIDFFTEYGVVLQSGAAIAATNWIIKANYMAASGTASSGVRCLSSYASSNNRGNTISENGILVYSGSTLSYGVLIDGTEEYYNRIVDNSLKATTYDCRITSGTTHLIEGNSFLGGGFSATTRNMFGTNFGTVLADPNVFLKRYAYTAVRQTVTYSASMTPDLAEANHFTIIATNATAFTVNLPTNYGTSSEQFTFTIRNTSGGALGVATWATGYKMSAWTQPATGFARSITFAYNPATTYFEEVSRTTADVPN